MTTKRHPIFRNSLPALLPAALLLAPALSCAASASSPTGDFYKLNTTQLWIIVGIMAFFTVDLLFVILRHRKTEAALQASVAQTRLLLNSAAEGIYGLDLDGRCTFLNPAGLRMLGYQNEDSLVGRDLHGLIHHTRKDGSPYAAEDCKICHAYQQNSRVHLEDEVFWRKDGSSFPVEYWSYPLQKGSRTIGAVVSFLDISERKEAERQLQEANRELDAFVSTASHDLRTPLTVIGGYVDLLRDEYGDRLDDEGLEYLAAIEDHGDRMTELIDDLLSLARAGTVPPPAAPVAVEGVVRDVLHRFKDRVRASGAQIELQSLPEVMVPETLLTEIFANLIGNALNYAVPTNPLITVDGERRDGRVRFRVRDHGPGIAAGETARIFEAFHRGATSRRVPGSGIGLATVQKIARLYGGQARVEGTPGGGATFLVEIDDPPGEA
ncbi:MAG TPA: ATP-binding protein [Desulfuromonadales bacterium]|nr:ATP-binding protein [Desulfuromonadales bacterium]